MSTENPTMTVPATARGHQGDRPSSSIRLVEDLVVKASLQRRTNVRRD
jgi:hypothetical protein